MPNQDPPQPTAQPDVAQRKIYIPLINDPPGAIPRVVIDPITRIEGHLRIEVQIKKGQVVDAWSSSTMFRGFEPILKNRDPRDAWVFAQRICGVCTTVHSIASVRAVENALGITIPDNARIIRNLIEGAQLIHDHVMHFYHLHALDWVDVVNALQADPTQTSDLQKSISSWSNNSPEYFAAVKTRLQNFVNSGQLGLFANGYWGHPAYILSPEANLLATAHYLEALEWQSQFSKFLAFLGGKNPHPQSYLVGGVSIPVDPTSAAAINPTRITQLRSLANSALDFVSQVYIPDLKLVASAYKDWANYGAGVGNYLAFGDYPTVGNDPASYWMPRGVIVGQNIGSAPGAMDHTKILEYINHSWYSYTGGNTAGKHPFSGETTVNYTGPTPPYLNLDIDGAYSWLKAPRYNNAPMEVGPLARMLVAYANGHVRARQLVDGLLSDLSVGAGALFSTLGRVGARGLETLMVAEQMNGWLDLLLANIEGGKLQIHDKTKWSPTSWPASATGWGTTEAPRGALGHWVKIAAGKISSYQMVVPSTWNGSPRDSQGQAGPWEKALIGTPVADPSRPVEILRTVHSFDPCMSCAVHIIDVNKRPITRVEFY